MITDQQFIKLINKSTIKNTLIGFGILAFGLFIIWLGMSGVDSEMDKMSTGGQITLYVFAAIFVLAGFLVMFIPLKNSWQIKKGKHPLINAIQNNDQHYVKWFYEHVIHVKSSGIKSGTNHQIWMMCKGKKQIVISISKDQAAEVISYLSDKFPYAMKGWTEEYQKIYESEN